MTSIKYLIFSLILSSNCIAAGEHFTNNEWYIGFEFGTADIDQEELLGTGLNSVEYNIHINTGYNLNSAFQVELSYGVLGNVSEQATFISDLGLFTGKVDSETELISLTTKYRYELNRRNFIFAEIGVTHWSIEASADVQGQLFGANLSSNDPVFGFGYQYFLYREMNMDFTVRHYDLDQWSLTEASVGLRYHF